MDYETAWRKAEDGKRQLIRQNEELQLRIDWLEERIIRFLEETNLNVADCLNDIKI